MNTRDPAAGLAGQTGTPTNLEDLLARVSQSKASTYRMVRLILDDLEQAAPWDDLYYPPTQVEEFLRKASLLHTIIEGIPQRVSQLIAEVEEVAEAERDEELLDDLSFFFSGIHMSVEQEMYKLQDLLGRFRADLPGREPTPEDRDFTFELCADLKGKYASSIMGAAASLIAGSTWRGVEIEPILFSEKAEEFERNERLVETLSEVTENIHNLLERVPLAHFVEQWKLGERVDQYALTDLYSLLGNLGKLMKDTSRRALYSGDYHQIQRRESLLASRVNELATLHNMSWGTVPQAAGQSREEAFARMVQTATELATVLHIDILKKIVGEAQVATLHQVVIVEKDTNSAVDRWRHGQRIKPHPDRAKIPEELHSLIVLLYDEDLHTFLELLLGSVLKRASLTVQKGIDAPALKLPVEDLLSSIEVVQPEDLAAQVEAAAADQRFQVSAAVEALPTELPEVDFTLLPEGEEPTQKIGVGGNLGSGGTEGANIGTSALGDSNFGGVDFGSGSFAGGDFAEGNLGETDVPGDGDREAWDSSTLDAELDTLSAPDMGGMPALQPYPVSDDSVAGRQERMRLLGELETVLDRLSSPTTPSRRSFQLIQRLLKQNRTIPPAMLQSMQPYLYDMMNELLPRMNQEQLAHRFSQAASAMVQDCQLLCRPQLGPELLRGPVPEAMQRISDLLTEVRSQVAEAIEELSGY